MLKETFIGIVVLILIAVVLFSCFFVVSKIPKLLDFEYLTNEEIVEQTKLCVDNGLRAVNIHHGLTFRTLRVQCEQLN